MLIGSDYLWEFVFARVKCGIGDEPRGIETVFGYKLSSPVTNVEDINVKHLNHSLVATTRVSLTLEGNHFSHFEDQCKWNHLERGVCVDHFDSLYTEEMSHFWDLQTIGQEFLSI